MFSPTALGEVGCVVVTGLLNAADRVAVRNELAPYIERVKVAQDDPAAFYPGLTRRTSALVSRSETVGRMVLHARTLELCDHFLIPNGKSGYQLHVSAALEVGPGARVQVLHREHDPFTFFPHPRPNLIVASMWAITDFRADNGATLLVPGSHTWAADRRATPSEIVAPDNDERGNLNRGEIRAKVARGVRNFRGCISPIAHTSSALSRAAREALDWHADCLSSTSSAICISF